MTMTSSIGTPFYMAPEMASGTKHYTGAVDVFSFAIMAAQVMTGKLVYDSSDAFDTEYGLLFSNHPFSQPKATKATVCVFALCFHLALVVVMEWAKHTAFVNAVCQGLRPRVSGCSAEMKTLIAACWHVNPSSHPCLSSFPSFFHASHFSFLSFFTLVSFFASTHQHLMPLLTHSVLSIDAPCSLCIIYHHKPTLAFSLFHNEVCVPSAKCALFALCHPHCLHQDECGNCHSMSPEWLWKRV